MENQLWTHNTTLLSNFAHIVDENEYSYELMKKKRQIFVQEANK